MDRGGVLLRLRSEAGVRALAFVPATIARGLAELSSFTPVPGTRAPVVGIALADGAVVTVLRVGPAPEASSASSASSAYEPGEDWRVPGADRALLCQIGGIEVALTGATVVATGVFDGALEGDCVLWRGEVVPVLDVRALYAQAEAATWAQRPAPPTWPSGLVDGSEPRIRIQGDDAPELRGPPRTGTTSLGEELHRGTRA